jgi:drug/metabolite transporter superfamily protein YnfA
MLVTMHKDKNKYQSPLKKQARQLFYIVAFVFLVSGIIMTIFNYSSSGINYSKYGSSFIGTVNGPGLIFFSIFLTIIAKFGFKD